MSFTVEKDVMVAMRDGVELATDAWIPSVTPAPTLLVRLPYGKDLPQLLAYGLVPNVFALVEAGYAVVYQDCRGTWRSGGEFVPMLNEPADGADTVAWLLRQPWCDGNIGSYGPSYLGFVQWASVSGGRAGEGDRPGGDHDRLLHAPWYSEGGAASWHTVQSWSTQMAMVETLRQLGRGAGDPQLLGELAGHDGRPAAAPGGDAVEPPARGREGLAVVDRAAVPPGRDAWWQDLSVLDRAEQVTVPALHIGGWFDIFVANTARSFTELRARAGTEEAREGQRLIIGPWDHLNATGIYPDRRFGLTADAITQDLTGQHVRFFDRWLRDRRDALDGSAPVKIFVMGIDQWREEQDWPLPDTRYVPYYLHGSGRANTAAGDGELSTEPPGADRDGHLPVRPAAAGAQPGRAGHAPDDRERGRPGRPAAGRGPRRRALLHLRRADRAARGHRARVADAVRVLLGAGHRLHRQAGRRVPGRARDLPDRRHHPGPVPQLAGRAGAAHARRALSSSAWTCR